MTLTASERESRRLAKQRHCINCGVVIGKWQRRCVACPDERTQAMAQMFRQGLTYQQIGDHHSITKQRVEQLFARFGISRDEGGAAFRRDQRLERREQALDARSFAKYGLPYAVMRGYRAQKLTAAFITQRNSARAGAISWQLTFAEWIAVWQASGKLQLRGRGRGKYVMSRISDSGPYIVGNVHIQLAEQNSRDAVKQWVGKTKANRGVFNLFPGLSKPWLARAGKVTLGYHATEAEAVAVRDAYFAKHGLVDGRVSAKGYTYVAKATKRPYQVVRKGKYIGSFATAEEAHCAYRQAVGAT